MLAPVMAWTTCQVRACVCVVILRSGVRNDSWHTPPGRTRTNAFITQCCVKCIGHQEKAPWTRSMKKKFIAQCCVKCIGHQDKVHRASTFITYCRVECIGHQDRKCNGQEMCIKHPHSSHDVLCQARNWRRQGQTLTRFHPCALNIHAPNYAHALIQHACPHLLNDAAVLLHLLHDLLERVDGAPARLYELRNAQAIPVQGVEARVQAALQLAQLLGHELALNGAELLNDLIVVLQHMLQALQPLMVLHLLQNTGKQVGRYNTHSNEGVQACTVLSTNVTICIYNVDEKKCTQVKQTHRNEGVLACTAAGVGCSCLGCAWPAMIACFV
eukprot:1158274-Pelagomonas_calceolata.AAC.15